MKIILLILFISCNAIIPNDVEEDAVFVQTKSVERRSQAWMMRMEEQMSEMAKTLADQATRIKQLEADHVAQCDFCDLVRTCVDDTPPTTTPQTTTTTTIKFTQAPTNAPTTAPTPHPCDDGSHGCDKGEGGICYKIVEGGENDKGYVCDCAQGWVCTDGCDEMFEGHTCALATEAPSAAPTVGVCEGFSDAYPDFVKIDLHLGELSHSNLGGTGPDDGEETLLYTNVAVMNDNDLVYDLKVTVIGDSYTPTNSAHNGIHGYFGQINVQTGTSVDVKFQFLDHNSGDPAPIQTVISWMDVDMGMNLGGKESIIPWAGYSKTLLASAAELEEESVSCPGDEAGTCVKYTATTGGTGADNPENPLTLTAQQAARTFAVYYENASEMRFTLAAEAGSKGRNFLFTGISEVAYKLVQECCPDHVCGATTTTTTLEPTTTTTTTPEATEAPTPAPTPHPCDDGSHGCDKGDGGICYKVDGGVNDEGWLCDCAQGYECTEGCDDMFIGHTCVATAAPTQEPTAEPTDGPTQEPTAEPTDVPTAAPTAEPTVAPTSVEDIACEESVTFDMSLDRLKENTLGQPGGQMLFKNTITIDGVALDLSVTDASGLPQYANKGYSTYEADSRNYTGSFLSAGRIAIDKPGDYMFRFKFIEMESGEPGTLPLFPVTFYDNDGGAEKIKACNVEFAIVDPNTNLDESYSAPCYTHSAPRKEVNLPSDWEELNTNQKRVSVSYVYKDTGEFDIGLSLIDIENRYFVFKSSKAFACALANDFGQDGHGTGNTTDKGKGPPKKKKKKGGDN